MSRVDEALGYLNKVYPVTKMIPNREKLLPSNEVFFPLRIIGQGKYHIKGPPQKTQCGSKNSKAQNFKRF